MKLMFITSTDGSVTSDCIPENQFQGYQSILHGGIVSTMLDDAMVHCLFSMGKKCVTRELNVRYLRPTQCGIPTEIKAWLEQDSSPLFTLKGEIRQGGKLTAKAMGSFADPAALRAFPRLSSINDLTRRR